MSRPATRSSARFQPHIEPTEATAVVVEDTAAAAVDSSGLTNYELERIENIRRNEEFLASLGIANLRNEVQQHQQQQRTSAVLKRGITGLKRKSADNNSGSSSRQQLPMRRSGRVTVERIRVELNDALQVGDAALAEQKQQQLQQLEEKKSEASYAAVIAAQNDDYNSRRERHSSDPISALRPINQPDDDDTDAATATESATAAGGDSDGWGRYLIEQIRALPGDIHTVCKELKPTTVSFKKSHQQQQQTGITTDDWPFASSASELDNYCQQLRQLRISDERGSVKVVPSRIYSCAFHPTAHKLLAYAGDKTGHIGIWDVDAAESDLNAGQDGVFLYQPHVAPVSCLYTSVHQQHKLWSCSYDGTVRCLDLHQQRAAFSLSLLAPGELESDANVLMELAFSGMNSANVGAVATAAGDDALFVCNCSGDVIAADARSGKLQWTAAAAPGRINSIQVHPTDPNLLVLGVGGRSSCVLIYDIRTAPSNSNNSNNSNSKKKGWQPLVQLQLHSKSVNSARVSPDGNYLITVGYDDTIRCCQNFTDPSAVAAFTSSTAAAVSKASTAATATALNVCTLRHNNNTGRWLSTFRPFFDLKHPHAFVLGSMQQPRRMGVFAVNRRTATTTTTTTATATSKATTAAVTGSGGLQLQLLCELQGDALASVCSRNAVHPLLHAIVGGNSSGRLHLFR